MMLSPKTLKKLLFFLTMMLLLLPTIILAQTNNTCPDIVNNAIQAADQLCEGLGRNTICYGNFKLDATPQDGVSDWTFEQVGDIANVNDLATLHLTGMNEANGEWGVAVMALQANLPDTLPGQNVIFILFGDVTVENTTTQQQVDDGEFSPMQAFYLTTGIGDAGCSEAPESGMLVQTPKGVGEVTFNVNGVDVAMGSTVFFQANTRQHLTATTVEGAAVFTIDGESFPILAGTRLGIERGEDGFIPLQNLPESYAGEFERLNVLPIGLLDREIEIEPPMDGEILEALHQRIEDGQPLCGEAPFPPCEEIPAIFGGIECVFPESFEDNRVPEEFADRPICKASQFFNGELREAIPQLPQPGVNCVLRNSPNNQNNLPLCSELIEQIEKQLDCVMRPPEGEELPAGETRPFCDEVNQLLPIDCVVRPPEGEELPAGETRPFCDEVNQLPQLEGCVMPPGPGETLPVGETRPLCEVGEMPPVDTRDCIYPPGPGAPPLPADETRPFCPEATPVNGDTRPCVTRPGPNDPPLPPDETRPFCDELPTTIPPSSGTNLLPPLSTLIPTIIPPLFPPPTPQATNIMS